MYRTLRIKKRRAPRADTLTSKFTLKLLHNKPGELQAKLAAYLRKDQTYKAVFDYTKSRFGAAEHLPAHNWSHIYRDTLNAIVIGEAERADMSIVLPAITMHDIGFLYGGDRSRRS